MLLHKYRSECALREVLGGMESLQNAAPRMVYLITFSHADYGEVSITRKLFFSSGIRVVQWVVCIQAYTIDEMNLYHYHMALIITTSLVYK